MHTANFILCLLLILGLTFFNLGLCTSVKVVQGPWYNMKPTNVPQTVNAGIMSLAVVALTLSVPMTWNVPKTFVFYHQETQM